MDIIQVITRELNVEKWQVEAAVKLIDEGCTIPFISRYRKEATGTLNDEQLRNLNERLTYLRNLEDKKAQVLGSIEEQGKLTPELKKQIEAAQTLVVVEDLYRPYRPKRRTRAIIAREKGLGPLADIILLQMTKKPLEEEAKAFLSEEKEVKTLEEAISGARDVSVESIYNYLRWLEQAFIIYPCERYDLQGKNILKTQEKYYLADVSLKYALLGYNRKMLDGAMENIVFLELKRRGYDVFIGRAMVN